MKTKVGVLKKHTYIHTCGGVTIKIRKGTKVMVSENVLTFNPIEGVRIVKCGQQYLVDLWGSLHVITFPKGKKKIPYPLSML